MSKRSAHYIIGKIDTPAGKVPVVRASLDYLDKLGSIKVRWGLRRDSYAVEPGIYAIGNPTPDSPVLVSANYKLTFDVLRQALKDLDAWLLIIDTKGINVWCAAGKGTFGTQEIVKRIEKTSLGKIVKHRKIILPQLAGPGVSAKEIHKESGFSVSFGPIRAEDIKSYIESNYRATREMRKVHFTFKDRLHLVPVELIGGLKYLFYLAAFFIVLSGFTKNGFSFIMFRDVGIRSFINLALSYLSGTVIGPLLLPWLPGKSFSMKGIFTGLIAVIAACYIGTIGNTQLELISWFLIMPAVSSFILMNFTGASTYTSLSGVKKEMIFAVPLQSMAAIIGIILWVLDRFLRG